MDTFDGYRHLYSVSIDRKPPILIPADDQRQAVLKATYEIPALPWQHDIEQKSPRSKVHWLITDRRTGWVEARLEVRQKG